MPSSDPGPPASSPSAPGAGTALLVPCQAPVIELRQVHAAYGRIEVLHGIDLSLPAGGVLALLGPNGAGKSTVLKVASGQLAPTSGCFHVLGQHCNTMSPETLARAGICTIPEG
ncbi:MAG TPA: ATP-binding cassette domain-containing protein, partial [Acidimicrobiales bacterium]|nr:ATP-binding cassette domain-containing protein [Acidimicrobiales bacterium]